MELDLYDAWPGECRVNVDRCDMDRGFRVTKVIRSWTFFIKCPLVFNAIIRTLART